MHIGGHNQTKTNLTTAGNVRKLQSKVLWTGMVDTNNTSWRK